MKLRCRRRQGRDVHPRDRLGDVPGGNGIGTRVVGVVQRDLIERTGSLEGALALAIPVDCLVVGETRGAIP